MCQDEPLKATQVPAQLHRVQLVAGLAGALGGADQRPAPRAPGQNQRPAPRADPRKGPASSRIAFWRRASCSTCVRSAPAAGRQRQSQHKLRSPEQPVAADEGAAQRTRRRTRDDGGSRRAGILRLFRCRQGPQDRVRRERRANRGSNVGVPVQKRCDSGAGSLATRVEAGAAQDEVM